MWNVDQRQGTVSHRLASTIRGRLLHLYPQNILARKRTATQPLQRPIERGIREHNSPDAPSYVCGYRRGWGRREVDLRAAVHQLAREVVVDGQDEIPEPIVKTELDRISKMLTCAAGRTGGHP